MKVLIVGSTEVYAIERFYAKHLVNSGVEVEIFAAQSLFYRYYNKRLLNKLIFKAGLSPIYASINKRFIETVEFFKPDIVWVFKGMEIQPSSLEQVRKLGVKLANYNPDNPFLFSGKGSGNSWITSSIPLYDLHLTYNSAIREQLITKTGSEVEYLPFGFELDANDLQHTDTETEVLRVCFLGNPDQNRAKFITQLAEANIPVDVYGHGWNSFVNHSNCHCFHAVYGLEFWKVLKKYRVQLNLMRIHNPDSHNMRSFEIPAVGGIMVAPRTPEHLSFFIDREEALFFSTNHEAVEIIHHLLLMPLPDALAIRNAARNRSLGSGYSYADRAGTVKDAFARLLQQNERIVGFEN